MITNKMKEVIETLNERFKYELDEDQHGYKEVWTFMDLDTIMKGDCEDYSLFVARELSGSITKMYWNLLTRKAKLHHVQIKSNSAGHCILEWDGHFVDNNFRKWVQEEDMKKVYNFKYRYIIPLIMMKFVVGFVGKLFGGKK